MPFKKKENTLAEVIEKIPQNALKLVILYS